jgi:diaminopimelate epimerase
MEVKFTKMHGAGNDFVVIDATKQPLDLNRDQLRKLGDRYFGVGADQILVVEKSGTPGIDFRYRIFNGASGDEVEQCGNGARCFVRYVHDKGLTRLDTIKVETINSRMELRLQADGRVTVDMGAPVFELARIPFDAQGAASRKVGDFELWPLAGFDAEVAVLSMGNPHAVQIVADVDKAPVGTQGPRIEGDTQHFPRKVNAGFMQVLNRGHVKLRVFERDAGETLSCGSGACAAVVAGIRLGLLDARVDVDTRGGKLTIEWQGGAEDPSSAEYRGRSPEGTAPGLGRPGARAPWAPVMMTGPAESVYEGSITL